MSTGATLWAPPGNPPPALLPGIAHSGAPRANPVASVRTRDPGGTIRSPRALTPVTVLLLLFAACSGRPAAETPPTTTPPAATTSTPAPASPTTAPTTTTLPKPPPVLGEAWGDLPLLDVAQARDGDLLIAGPEGILLVREGEPLGRLHDQPTQVTAPDGIGGIVYQTPFRVEGTGNGDLWWLPGTGGKEYLGIPNTPLGYFRLQEVDWVPRLGRYEDGAWIPTYNGLTALFADSGHDTAGVLVTTRNPQWPADHWSISLPPGGQPTAVASTGRHRVWAARTWSTDGWQTRLEFLRVDGTADTLPHNPLPELVDGWIPSLDAEPGGSLLAYALGSGSAVPFGAPTSLRVVDLTDGIEVLDLPIGNNDQQIVRLDLHHRTIAVSTLTRVPGGASFDLVRVVDLDAGTVTTLPWGGTASFFHLAEPLPAAPYPAVSLAVPELVVAAPIEGTVVTDPLIRFDGYATPGATVTAAGHFPVVVAENGRWSTTLVLEPGGNLAEFQATLPGGGTAETAVAVFLSVGPEMGYILDLHYERGAPPTWEASVWVYDTTTGQRLAGATVTLSMVTAYPEVPPVTLVTNDLGLAVHRIPIDTAPMGACLLGLELDGYPSPIPPAGADLPSGAITCVWADYP